MKRVCGFLVEDMTVEIYEIGYPMSSVEIVNGFWKMGRACPESKDVKIVVESIERNFKNENEEPVIVLLYDNRKAILIPYILGGEVEELIDHDWEKGSWDHSCFFAAISYAASYVTH